MSVDRAIGRSSRVTLPAVIGSEALKLASLRSAWWLAGSALLAPLAITAIWAANQFSANPMFPDVFEAATAPLGETVILLCLLATVAATSEYESRAITATFSVVPQRTPVIVAKAVVVFVAAAVVGVLALMGSFVIANAMGGGAAGLSEPPVARAILGLPLFYACAAVIAMAIGMLIRSTIGAIALTLVFLYLLPSLLKVLGWSVTSLLADTIPSSAANSFSSADLTGQLPPLAAAIAMLAWAAIWVAVTAWVTKRRDA